MDQAIAIGFAVPAISIGMCAIFACFWYYNREDRAAPLFAAAFTMCALGFFLNHFVLAKETMANAILHNSCYALGLYFLSDGLHRSFDRRTPYEALAALGILSVRSEEHTSELQSLAYLVCRLLLEKKKNNNATELSPSHNK